MLRSRMHHMARGQATTRMASGASRSYDCWRVGRIVLRKRCINLRTTAIEEAECKACQRSDNRREIAEYEREQREATRAAQDFNPDRD